VYVPVHAVFLLKDSPGGWLSRFGHSQTHAEDRCWCWLLPLLLPLPSLLLLLVLAGT
jgi:hypothetical protein